jgi:hypothetical protein
MYVEMTTLKTIVDSVFNLDLLSKNRKRPFVDAKKIFSNIIIERGASKSDVARFLDVNHATVIYYRRTFFEHIEIDKTFREQYLEVLKRFEKRHDPIYHLNSHQLREACLSYKEEINELYLKLESLESKCRTQENRYEKLKDLHEFIDKNVDPSKSQKCIVQLNRILNGL